MIAFTAFIAPVICAQTINIRPAPTVELPSPVDSNSPSHWSNGRFVVFDSMGLPYRTEGSGQFNLEETAGVVLGYRQPSPVWIESTWLDDDGTLFAWYHYEPGGICPGNRLTAPRIGAMVSYDDGHSFRDLGLVLESGDPADCFAQNGYFAGGNGDFSVIADANREYFYLLFSNYGGDVSTQGVAVARMAFKDRFNPRGSVWKYHNGAFSEPGIGGRVTPTFPANASWMGGNTDAFWGPSVHWNTALNRFVMLLNRSCCSPGWPQEGIYVSTNADLSDPLGWSAPAKLIDGGGWYPQVIGEDAGGTDKLAGAVSRLYIYGVSNYELVVTDGSSPESDSVSDWITGR